MNSPLLIVARTIEPYYMQPRSQDLSSSCLLERERRDPGWVWSRVSQKNGRSKVNDSREGQISRKFVANASRGEREVLLSNEVVFDLPDSCGSW